MKIDDSIRINSIKLNNFRCFSNISIDFHPKLTVLVAENAQGKTAILDAISISLGLFVDTLTGWKQYPGFDRADVRNVFDENLQMINQLPLSFFASGTAGGVQISWDRELPGVSGRARTSTRNCKDLIKYAKVLHEKMINNQPDLLLPVIAFYGTGRLWSEHRLTEFRKNSSHVGTNAGRMGGYLDCLSSSSSFKEFAEWYGSAVRDIADARFKVLEQDVHPLKWISAVRDAVKRVLEPTGWSIIDWDNNNSVIVAENHKKGRLPLDLMSDGIRNMISLIADLAHRCARLNPNLGETAARDTPGILLIDEVDMHLHPRWQQLIVQLLEDAFPRMQIILTTHSPHVLTTVDKNSIRVIDTKDGLGIVRIPEFQTKGVESADVLAVIMGVDPIPQIDESIMLTKYRSLIEDGEYESDDAINLKNKLNEHFGVNHPVMIDCNRLIRFQSLKRRSN